jgi:hypothetical protein
VADTYVDSLRLIEGHVGYGEPGLHGVLGYEGKHVSVGGRKPDHPLSAHPPARLLFETGGRYTSFRAEVALNDDVRSADAHASFLVFADGRQVAVEPYVRSDADPIPISAAIEAAHTLDLVVRSGRWEHCHAVWVDPTVSDRPADPRPRTIADCLGRVDIEVPPTLPSAARCIATVVTPGFDHLLDDLLGSLTTYGNCRDCLIVVLSVEGDPACRRVIEKYGATEIPCTKRGAINATIKSVLYTAPHVVNAEYFLCLDADMLVLGDVRPVFGALEACPEGSVLACREGNSTAITTLEHAISNIYGGRASDFMRILGSVNGEPGYSLVVNDGLFAAGRAALLALDGLIRTWTNAPGWVDERRDVWWRNQFVFNLALARLKCGVELDAVYNINLHTQHVDLRRANGAVEAIWRGRGARVLHFNGWGRNKYPAWRRTFGLPTRATFIR